MQTFHEPRRDASHSPNDTPQELDLSALRGSGIRLPHDCSRIAAWNAGRFMDVTPVGSLLVVLDPERLSVYRDNGSGMNMAACSSTPSANSFFSPAPRGLAVVSNELEHLVLFPKSASTGGAAHPYRFSVHAARVCTDRYESIVRLEKGSELFSVESANSLRLHPFSASLGALPVSFEENGSHLLHLYHLKKSGDSLAQVSVEPMERPFLCPANVVQVMDAQCGGHALALCEDGTVLKLELDSQTGAGKAESFITLGNRALGMANAAFDQLLVLDASGNLSSFDSMSGSQTLSASTRLERPELAAFHPRFPQIFAVSDKAGTVAMRALVFIDGRPHIVDLGQANLSTKVTRLFFSPDGERLYVAHERSELIGTDLVSFKISSQS